jgi:hypothetical protein
LPEQPSGGCDQKEQPGQLDGPTLRGALGKGVALTCARYTHANPQQIGRYGRAGVKALCIAKVLDERLLYCC